jgi:hypothetical protein
LGHFSPEYILLLKIAWFLCDRLFLGINFMAVENTLIQIHKVCEPIIGFLNGGSGAAILAGFLTFVASRWSAEADRKEKIKDCRESFQKILPNYIERIKEMIETLNSERIRLSGENTEGPNTGSLASGKLLKALNVKLEFVKNLPLTDFFSYPEVVEAYTDKSHKSKLSHVRKIELIHSIFGSFESVYSNQLDCINLYKDSGKERIERIYSLHFCFKEVLRSLNILANMSGSIHQSLETELNSELSKTLCDYRRVNEILRNFREGELFKNTPYPYREDVGYKEHQAQLNAIELFKASSLSDAIISHDIVFQSVMAIEKQILVNFEDTHDSLERHLKDLKRNFKELSGEPNGDN